MKQDIKQAVDVLKKYSNWYEDNKTHKPTTQQLVQSINTVLDYVEIDFVQEQLSSECCSCCDDSEGLGALH